MSIPDEMILREYHRHKALSPSSNRLALESQTARTLETTVERVRETLDFFNSGLAS